MNFLGKVLSQSIYLRLGCYFVFLIWLALFYFNKAGINIWFSRLAALSLLIVIFTSVPIFLKMIRQLDSVRRKLFFAVAIPWTFLVFLFWPGMFVLDLLKVIQDSKVYYGNIWNSYAWSSFIMAIGQIDPSFFLITILFVGMYFSLLLRILILADFKRWIQKAIFLLLNLLPCLFMFLIFTYRDVLQSLLMGHLVVHIFEWLVPQKGRTPLSRFYLAEALIFAIIIVQLKIDAALAMGALGGFLVVRFAFKKDGRSIFLTAVALAIGLGLKSLAPSVPQYEMTGIMNNLAVVLKQGSPLNEADQKIIGEFVNIEGVRSRPLELYIDVYKDDIFPPTSLKRNEWLEHWRIFRKKALELCLINWDKILEYRWKTFLQAVNFDRSSYIWQDQYDLIGKSLSSVENNWITMTIEFLSPLRNFIFQFFNNLAHTSFIGEMFFSYGFYMLAFVSLVFWARKDFRVLILVGFIALRVVPAILTMPGPMFKYFGSLLFPVIALAVLIFCKKAETGTETESETMATHE